jgi:hypothetical protein
VCDLVWRSVAVGTGEKATGGTAHEPQGLD